MPFARLADRFVNLPSRISATLRSLLQLPSLRPGFVHFVQSTALVRFCMAVGAIQSGDALPSVSLSEVLQLALPAGSSALAGADQLGRRVHWARLLRARPAGLVEPGELLLLPAGLLDSLSDSRVVPR